jgi:hypothetical protein
MVDVKLTASPFGAKIDICALNVRKIIVISKVKFYLVLLKLPVP